jgi:hypothetical protein
MKNEGSRQEQEQKQKQGLVDVHNEGFLLDKSVRMYVRPTVCPGGGPALEGWNDGTMGKGKEHHVCGGKGERQKPLWIMPFHTLMRLGAGGSVQQVTEQALQAIGHLVSVIKPSKRFSAIAKTDLLEWPSELKQARKLAVKEEWGKWLPMKGRAVLRYVWQQYVLVQQEGNYVVLAIDAVEVGAEHPEITVLQSQVQENVLTISQYKEIVAAILEGDLAEKRRHAQRKMTPKAAWEGKPKEKSKVDAKPRGWKIKWKGIEEAYHPAGCRGPSDASCAAEAAKGGEKEAVEMHPPKETRKKERRWQGQQE